MVYCAVTESYCITHTFIHTAHLYDDLQLKRIVKYLSYFIVFLKLKLKKERKKEGRKERKKTFSETFPFHNDNIN